MPNKYYEGAGPDEKTFGPPPQVEKPFVMPADPFADIKGGPDSFPDEVDHVVINIRPEIKTIETKLIDVTRELERYQKRCAVLETRLSVIRRAIDGALDERKV